MLKKKFFDVILCQCSINSFQVEKFLILCDIIGTKECKVFCIPWLGDDHLEKKYYKEELNKINYGESELTERKNEEMQQINYIMKYNAIITKNIKVTR